MLTPALTRFTHSLQAWAIPPAIATKRLQKRHREMLIISLLTIALACSLQVVNTDRVAFFFLPNLPLPQLCFSRAWFNIECPGCGLTRSFVHLAHGDLAASWQSHHLGWLLAALTLAQIPYRLYCLSTGKSLPTRITRLIGTTLILLLLANWLLHLILH